MDARIKNSKLNSYHKKDFNFVHEFIEHIAQTQTFSNQMELKELLKKMIQEKNEGEEELTGDQFKRYSEKEEKYKTALNGKNWLETYANEHGLMMKREKLPRTWSLQKAWMSHASDRCSVWRSTRQRLDRSIVSENREKYEQILLVFEVCRIRYMSPLPQTLVQLLR